MKRKILSAALFVAIAVAAGWNFNQSKNEMALSDVALANVDALASGESSGLCKGKGDVYCEYNEGWVREIS